jgi:hypothetical protein
MEVDSTSPFIVKICHSWTLASCSWVARLAISSLTHRYGAVLRSSRHSVPSISGKAQLGIRCKLNRILVYLDQMKGSLSPISLSRCPFHIKESINFGAVFQLSEGPKSVLQPCSPNTRLLTDASQLSFGRQPDIGIRFYPSVLRSRETAPQSWLVPAPRVNSSKPHIF